VGIYSIQEIEWKMKDPTDYNVRAVERALQILSSFDDQHPERGLSDIAQVVELHKATTHRIVTTLVNYGYLERAADGQKYRLGLQLMDLGFKAIRRMDLRREALPYMTQLAQQLEEACDLSIFDRGEVFYIEYVQGPHALTVAAEVGQRLPPYCTASGKLFLANLPPNELDVILTRPRVSYTDKTITSTNKLRNQLIEIRKQGYAVDDEEYEIGIRAVSAAIRNQQGSVVASVSIPGPTGRMSVERLPKVVYALMEAARAISRRMGWNP
jgi:IclR family KDG regulon transcriptional repressor